jgi:phospholipase C
MPLNLDQVGTIVIVLMENRSFDHLLGYLSLPKYGVVLDGIEDSVPWRQKYANLAANGFAYEPYAFHELHVADPPHERENITAQLGIPDQSGVFPMKGFIESAGDNVEVMGYYTSEIVPVTDFFARNFRVCDKWFAPLPAGTQANRLMAMSGKSQIDINVSTPLEFPDQSLAYDWLKDKGITWRVYHQGFFPFFSMMPRWYPEIVKNDSFRRFDHLTIDWDLEPDETFPKVIFIEPKYTDSPHIGEGTDDHSPSSVLEGQRFLLDIYKALISNRSRWLKTVMILTYDEHGGFFDHVQPLPLVTSSPTGEYPDFKSTGPRVPAIIISPFVTPGRVCSTAFDHTSILKFLGQKFGAGSYSPEVDNRHVGSVLDALDLTEPQQVVPSPPALSAIPSAIPYVRGFKPQTENVQMFQNVALELSQRYPHALASKFPEHRDFLGL